jgi:cysteine synthase A
MGEFFDRTGLRIGGSAAANWRAAYQVARRLGPDDAVVTLFACAGTPEEWERLGR